jgi:hypothetical protein
MARQPEPAPSEDKCERNGTGERRWSELADEQTKSRNLTTKVGGGATSPLTILASLPPIDDKGWGYTLPNPGRTRHGPGWITFHRPEPGHGLGRVTVTRLDPTRGLTPEKRDVGRDMGQVGSSKPGLTGSLPSENLTSPPPLFPR